MPLVRDLHPEFGYLGSLHLFGRKIGLVLVFLGFGVMAGISGLTVFMADEQPDPMKAMALAPPEAIDSNSVAPAPVQPSVRVEPAAGAAGAKTANPSCAESTTGDCARLKPFRPRFVPAANERPAIAAVPIGRVDPPPMAPSMTPSTTPSTAPAAAPAELRPAPAVAPSQPVAVATAPATEDVSTQPAEAAAPAPAPAPPTVVKKLRPRIEHAERSDRYRGRERESSSRGRSNYGSATWAGYARVY